MSKLLRNKRGKEGGRRGGCGRESEAGTVLAGAIWSSLFKNIYTFFKVTQGHGNPPTPSLMIFAMNVENLASTVQCHLCSFEVFL